MVQTNCTNFVPPPELTSLYGGWLHAHIYTRHAADCSHANDTQWRRCRCPKWLRGILPNGKPIRVSAGTRSWEQAERNARKKEAEADPTRIDQVQVRRATVKDAIRTCLEDEEARGLEHSSRKKSRTLLECQFLPFCEARKFVHLDQVLPIDLTEFRSTWNNGEATTHRKHERMHSSFAFCVANDMLRKNPMDAIKKPKRPDVVPTDYFLPKEFEQIVAATEKYEYGGGNDNEHRGQRLRALTLLMRWSGLAILDATSLERERLSTNGNDDDQIFLYRAKTGVAVNVVIPNEVSVELRALPTRIRVISSGRGTAIHVAPRKRSSGRTGSSSSWQTFSSPMERRSGAIRICSATPSRLSCC